jgi:hypothetical protein
MEDRVARAVVGVLWVACGVVIILSPPVEHADGDTWSSWFGWLVVAGGVILLGIAIWGAIGGAPGTRYGRHSNGRTARSEGRVELRLIVALVVVVLMGGGFIWMGIDTDQAAVTSYGVVALSLAVFMVPHVVDVVDHLQRR